MGKILLIDDAQFARSVLRTILEDKGYVICGEAENGREGVEMYKQLKPDMVFCDIRMNEMDGKDCVRTILAEDPKAKVVVCSSVEYQSSISDLIKAGAKGYIGKPINAMRLLHVTKELIGEP